MSWVLECEAPMGKTLRVRRHRLHNGLRLVSLADHGAPIVAYQTWFAVGSRNETPGSTGMAHFFEHMMFNQTRSMPLGEFDRRIEATGGNTNAATWVDWTYYQDSVPSRDLDLIARLEAERMVDLVLAHDVVEAEREVIMNERLERVDDDVDGFASEELFRRAFLRHPYHAPTIGWMEDIKSLSIPAMQDFYRNYYAPDNATLVVVGDFQESELLAIVERHYGDVSASAIDAPSPPVEPAQTSERRFDYTKDVSAARLLNGYKAPGQSEQDWPDAMFTCHLLAGSASSPLHRELVIDKELASSIYCEIMPFRDPSLIEIAAVATKGTNLDTLQETLDASLARIASSPIPAAEVQKVRNLAETEFWSALTTVDGKAEALGHYECTHGDFRKLFSMTKRLSRIDAADVQRVLHTYFRPEGRTVIRIEAPPADSPPGDGGSEVAPT